MGSANLRRALGGILILFLFYLPLSMFAQSPVSQQPQPGQIGVPGQKEEPIPKDIADRMAREQMRDRYDSLKRDSERLLELATELKQYVDKSGQDVMSLEVIRKCDQIEKLSKSVRAKMKGN
ncbi:MAG: hypothetical protein ROO76_00050 [Terriglobia bacterium]|nr:hypothetical protein [Terriglobia bacterium]